ncbi:hypothetical protein skT53_02290 [Effusibacillus dendaii]|uniref:Uncharacterized protein n=2 Tax=Effusibacillus dendaii TaxID=2743772 RepID=A0A7I8D566_9BACL|nr:hypothetical protein skT53_02290 [Effusibacillus dendaii]
MVARLQHIYTEGGVLIQDVPVLFCPTCLHTEIAPDIEMDFHLFAHNCETDRVRSASLSDAVGDEKILQILEKYPEDERIRSNQRVLPEQIDATLDLMITAKQQNDQAWYNELVERLQMFRSLLGVKRG